MLFFTDELPFEDILVLSRTMYIHCGHVLQVKYKSLLGIHQHWCTFTPLFNRFRVNHDKRLLLHVKNSPVRFAKIWLMLFCCEMTVRSLKSTVEVVLKNMAKKYFFQTCSHDKRNYKHMSDCNNKKQIIKAGASDLRICTVVSCISDSHIHQSQ